MEKMSPGPGRSKEKTQKGVLGPKGMCFRGEGLGLRSGRGLGCGVYSC